MKPTDPNPTDPNPTDPNPAAANPDAVGPNERLAEDFNAAWHAHDLAAALDLCTPDVAFESTDPAPDGRRFEGRAAVRDAWAPVFDNEHGRFAFEEIFVTAERIVQRWRYDWGSGHVRGVDVIVVRDGLVAEKRSYVKG